MMYIFIPEQEYYGVTIPGGSYRLHPNKILLIVDISDQIQKVAIYMEYINEDDPKPLIAFQDITEVYNMLCATNPGWKDSKLKTHDSQTNCFGVIIPPKTKYSINKEW